MALYFDCEVEPEVLQELATTLPYLRTIGFRCASFTSKHGRAIAQFKSLGTLTIANSTGNLSGLKHLKDKRLWSLKFHNSKLDCRSLETIVDCMPNISHIELRKCQTTDDDLIPISKLTKIRSLVITDCNISDLGVRNLKSLPALQYLTINDAGITNESMQTILDNFPRLFILKANGVSFDEGIIPMLAKVDRQIYVKVPKSSVSRSQAEAAGEKVARILN